jgi:hypothetical protein
LRQRYARVSTFYVKFMHNVDSADLACMQLYVQRYHAHATSITNCTQFVQNSLILHDRMCTYCVTGMRFGRKADTS